MGGAAAPAGGASAPAAAKQEEAPAEEEPEDDVDMAGMFGDEDDYWGDSHTHNLRSPGGDDYRTSQNK